MILRFPQGSANSAFFQCLSQEVEEQCKFQFSAIIMMVVIICNIVKLSCMVWIAWRQDSEPLVTLGDVIDSFLKSPDKYTAGNCLAGKNFYSNKRAPRQLLTKEDLKEAQGPWSEWTGESDKPYTIWGPRTLSWLRRRYFWSRAPSWKRWVLCNLLWVIRFLLK